MDGPDLIQKVVLFFIPVVVSLAFHEWGHAASANALGDPTAKEQGRLTLNPVAHMDLVGTVLVPLALIASGSPFLFGWAKPVPVSPHRFSRKVNMNTGLMLTAAAGPAMNIALAVTGAVALAAFQKFDFMPGGRSTEAMLLSFVVVNVLLCLFNLLPVPPLDGSRVLGGLLPAALRRGYQALERFSWAFIMLIFLTGIGATLISGPTQTVVGGIMAFARFIFPPA